jgi:uncharacterized cupredoxin-like copper-binding protein
MRRFRFVLLVLVLVAAGVATTALAARYDAVRARSVTTVKASVVEWGIKTSKKTSHAGKVSFAVRNAGKLAHQFIVLRTNLPANKLPYGTTVNLKKAGKVLGKISLAPGKNGHISLTLKTGHYVLLCNLPAHYQLGQHAAFQVK